MWALFEIHGKFRADLGQTRKKQIWVLSEVEPTTFRFPVQMLCHWANLFPRVSPLPAPWREREEGLSLSLQGVERGETLETRLPLSYMRLVGTRPLNRVHSTNMHHTLLGFACFCQHSRPESKRERRYVFFQEANMTPKGRTIRKVM